MAFDYQTNCTGGKKHDIYAASHRLFAGAM